MEDQGSYGSGGSGGSRDRNSGYQSRRTSSDSHYSMPRTFTSYRDDAFVGGSLSNAPVWPNHSCTGTMTPAETFQDEDQFSFSPINALEQNTIVGKFRPSLEDMVDVNVSTHGMSFSDMRNQPDHKVRRSSVFSVGFDDSPFDSVGMTNRRFYTWCCLATAIAVVVVLAVTLTPSGGIDSGSGSTNGSATPTIPDIPSTQSTYVDPTLIAAECDFSNILQPDPFLQCRCSGHLTVFSETSLENYNDLKNNFIAKHILPGYHSKIDSCHPSNLALAWLASDTYPVETEKRDRYMLALLYASWQGAGWKNQDNWLLTSQSHCNWYGVECDMHNRTVDLLLNDNNLAGPIPAEIVKLDTLATLAIADNKIDGHLPRELGQWRSIQRLKLSDNQLLSSIPTELGLLENLQSLELDHNQLHGYIPTEIMRLPVLEFVSLWANDFVGSIPTEVGNLKQCREFKVYSNSLTGDIPTQVGNMNKLKVWSSSGNPTGGSIPAQFGNIGTLKTLDLSVMGLTGSIPTHLGNLASLETLNLADNYLSGKIPSHLGDMPMMAFLYLNHNGLLGSIPSQLSQLRELTKLNLQENHLTGEIPKELASCDKLKGIDFSGNKFSGNVPEEVCSLRSLQLISMISDCRDTEITCDVPSCCTECAP